MPYSDTNRIVDRAGDGRGDDRRRWLPDAARVMTRIDEFDIDRRNIHQADRLVVVEVALFERAVLEGQPLRHDLARFPESCALDLRLGIERIDQRSRSHGDGRPFDLVSAGLRVDGDLRNAGDPGRALTLLGRRYGNAHSRVRRELLRTPAGSPRSDSQAVEIGR